MAQLERVRIAEQAHKYPLQLSGGQQQRVAIARALCLTPKIMLFDEPTSALDPEMIKEVLDVMVELADQGMTMLCVTHEMGFATRGGRPRIFMDEGQIIEQNTPDEFFAAPAERARAGFPVANPRPLDRVKNGTSPCWTSADSYQNMSMPKLRRGRPQLFRQAADKQCIRLRKVEPPC